MEKIILISVIIFLWVGQALAGCIGPVIMGKCQGQTVPWDTHQDPRYETPQAPPGFYWDKRGTEYERKNPGLVDPFTGRDPNDSDWYRREKRAK